MSTQSRLDLLGEMGELVEMLPAGFFVQVEEYLRGERKVFEGDFEQEGTEFQRRVWKVIEKIPYGETLSYAEVAAAVGSPRAMRAVGSACGKNGLPIVVPCHRVVASNGIGGYAFDIGIKKRLLDLEQRNSQ